MPKTMTQGLTQRQVLFVQEFQKDQNAYAAAIRAGYAHNTAKGQAYKWAHVDKSKCPNDYHDVWEACNKIRIERLEKIGIDADYVLNRHAEIDRLDPVDILNDDGTVKPLSAWPKAWRVSISAIEVMELASAEDDKAVRAIMKKIKWPDKLKNLEVLGNHVGVQAYRTQTKHEGEIIVFDSDYGERNAD